MENAVEEYFTKALTETEENKYFVCRRFDVLLRKKEGKFYAAINWGNLVLVQMAVSESFFKTYFIKYTPNEN
jgi:hypothetical protein